MIRYKSRNKTGFSFVELMFAVTIIGICITALLTLQGTMLSTLAERTESLRRTFVLKNILYPYLVSGVPEKAEGKLKEITIAEPRMKVVVHAYPISEKSLLHRFVDVATVTVRGTWERDGITYDQHLVTFVPRIADTTNEKKEQ